MQCVTKLKSINKQKWFPSTQQLLLRNGKLRIFVKLLERIIATELDK